MKGAELPRDLQGAAWARFGTALHDGQAGVVIHILEAKKAPFRRAHRGTPGSIMK